MRDFDEKNFDKFLNEVELRKAPETFTDDFMKRWEAGRRAKKQEFTYFAFIKYYAAFIAAAILASVYFTGNSESVEGGNYRIFDAIKALLPDFSFSAFEPNLYMAAGFAIVFLFMLIDFLLGSRNNQLRYVS